MDSETSSRSSEKEVIDFVASELPDQSLPSEKDTIQLAILIKYRKYGHKTALDSPGIGNIFSLKRSFSEYLKPLFLDFCWP